MRSRNGEVAAFEELIFSYEKKIFNIALRMVGNPEDARDVAQEVCIKIFKSIRNFKGDSSFSTWVYRITSNVCIDEIRKRKKNVIPLAASGENGEFEIIPIDHSDLPEEIAERKELSKLIRSCILELAADYKMLIVYRDIYGYTYEEISKILNLSMGTVKSRLSRARNLLKDKLKNREPFKSKTV